MDWTPDRNWRGSMDWSRTGLEAALTGWWIDAWSTDLYKPQIFPEKRSGNVQNWYLTRKEKLDAIWIYVINQGEIENCYSEVRGHGSKFVAIPDLHPSGN